LARVLGRRRTLVKALNTSGVSTGDRVVIGLEEGALVSGSMAVYLVPLIALIVGAALATALAPERDIVAAAGGAAGLVSSFFWLRRFGTRIRIDPRYQPIILRRFRDVSVINLPVEAVNRPGECE